MDVSLRLDYFSPVRLHSRVRQKSCDNLFKYNKVMFFFRAKKLASVLRDNKWVEVVVLVFDYSVVTFCKKYFFLLHNIQAVENATV